MTLTILGLLLVVLMVEGRGAWSVEVGAPGKRDGIGMDGGRNGTRITGRKG